MAISVRKRVFGPLHWTSEEGNLIFPNLISRGERKFFVINPETISSLEANKDSVLTPAQINDNLIYLTDSDLVVSSSDYADSNWENKGWDVSDEDSITSQIQEFIVNNFEQQDINTNFYDVVVIITKGNIDGTNYTIPFAYFGIAGEEINIEPEIVPILLSHFNVSLADSSGNNHSFTTSGNLNYPVGKFENGYRPTPSNNAYYTHSSLLNLGEYDFTIDCWFKFTAGAGLDNYYLVSKTNNAQNQGWALLIMTNRIRFLCHDEDENLHFMDSEADGSLITQLESDLCHIAVVRKNSDFYLFFNGQEVASMSFSGNMQNTSDNLGIGRRWESATASAISGIIDELYITTGARWTSNFTPPRVRYAPPELPDSNTSMLLHFNNNFQEDINDLGGTVNGSPVFGSGIFTQGLVVSSGNNYLIQDTLGDGGALDFGTGDFTIDFWARVDSENTFYTLFSVLGGGNTLFLQINSTNNLRYGYGNSTVKVSSGTISSFGATFRHFALIREGDDIKVYYNGTLIDTDNQLGSGWVQPHNVGCDWILGAANSDGTSLPLAGRIDEFRVSKGVARWTSNFTPPTAPY